MKLFLRFIHKLLLFILAVLIGCATNEEMNKTDADTLLNQGIAYLKRGQYEEAITNFSKAIEIDPEYVTAYDNRGVAYAKQGQLDQAFSDYNKAIEINPKRARSYNNRGFAYHRKGLYDKAISDYNKAIEINPRYAMAYVNRGIAYEKKGQYDMTISDYSRVIELKPNDPLAYNAVAWILSTCPDAMYRNGIKAIELAKKALELDTRAITVDTLAAAYAETGKFEDAIITQEKAINMLKKEDKLNNTIDQFIEHLKSYKAHKPWREK